MISGKFAWFIAVLLTVFKDCCCSNATQAVTGEEAFLLTTPTGETSSIIAVTPPSSNTSRENLEITASGSSANDGHLEAAEIFHGNPNLTTATEQIIIMNATNCLNITSVNASCVDQSRNDTFRTKYTTVAEAVGASESFPERLQNTAAIAAGIFLVSAVIGYFSCVGYRRFLQRKYGNSQILIGEEVYDTTDLRYFEI